MVILWSGVAAGICDIRTLAIIQKAMLLPVLAGKESSYSNYNSNMSLFPVHFLLSFDLSGLSPFLLR
jgi:hypothetical protein